MSRGPKLLVLALLIVLLASASAVIGAFMVHNSDWVVVRLPEPRWQWPNPIENVEFEAQLSWLLLGTFAAGGVFVLLAVALPAALRRAYERRKERRRARDLEAEIADLRSLPVIEPAPFEEAAPQPKSIVAGQRAGSVSDGSEGGMGSVDGVAPDPSEVDREGGGQ